MKKTVIARTYKGREYMFITSDAFHVTPKKAQYVADLLNKRGYKILRNDMYWRVFTDTDEFCGSNIMLRAVIRKSCISFYYVDE